MKTQNPSRSMLLGTGLAVLLHGLLFVGADCEPPVESDHPSPPSTRYAAFMRSPGSDEGDARVVNSPVLFSLPSQTGFSRTLFNRDVTTRLSFPHNMDTEAYLPVDPARDSKGRRLEVGRWMAGRGRGGPGLPQVDTSKKVEPETATPRVVLDPALEQRLINKIVLPPILNRSVETPWEVQAELEINKQGLVEHVFFEQPLEDAALNHAVVRLLHGLRFRSGPAGMARVEVYAPVTTGETDEEASP